MIARVAIVAAAVLAGCTERIDTPIVFDLPLRCDAEPGTMIDTYAVTLFAMDDPTRRCNECLMSLLQPDPDICSIVTTYCFCGPEVEARSEALAMALESAQIEDIDPELVFCLNVVALDAPGSGQGAVAACECPAEGAAVPRVCALSAVGAVNEAGVPITIPQVACSPSMTFGLCSLTAMR